MSNYEERFKGVEKKDFLIWENKRNKANQQLYIDILKEAFGDEDAQCIIGHHLTIDKDGHANEIPSADTLIFDHFTAQRIFGDQFKQYLQELAITPVEVRDQKFAELYYNRPR